MNTVTGTVTSATAEYIMVEFDRTPGCGACASGLGCGFGPLLHLFTGSGARAIRLSNSSAAPLRSGDRIRVAIAGRTLALYAGLAYGWPLVGVVAGAAIGASILPAGGDLAAATGAALGAAVAWFALKWQGAVATGLQSRLFVVR
ncbi:MAG: SoxR reducing system RseC family protein [Gammaproteobacteria bacterium]